MLAKGLIFSEPSIAETGVWCTLNGGIDPSEWAYLCRYIGRLSPREFRVVIRGSWGISRKKETLRRFSTICF